MTTSGQIGTHGTHRDATLYINTPTIIRGNDVTYTQFNYVNIRPIRPSVPKDDSEMSRTKNRNHPARRSYQQRLIEENQQRKPGLYIAHIFHDDNCPIFQGGECNCDFMIRYEKPFSKEN